MALPINKPGALLAPNETCHSIDNRAPDCIENLAAFLPEPARAYLLQNSSWHETELPLAIWFNPPSHFLFNRAKLKNPDPTTLHEFYEGIGKFFTYPLKNKSEFDEKTFLDGFARGAKKRNRGDMSYALVTATDDTTQLFTEYFWTAENQPLQVAALWDKAEAEVERLQAIQAVRQRGSYQIPRKVSQLFSFAEESLRLLKRQQLEISTTLQGGVDPATQANRTTFSVNGIWERASLDGLAPNGSRWHSDPVAGLEGRFVSPFLDSDFLLLGGAKVHFESLGNLELTPRAGYSLRKLVAGDQWVPGFEVTAVLGESYSKDSFWQLAATIRQALALKEEPTALTGGVFWKYVR